MHVVYTYI